MAAQPVKEDPVKYAILIYDENTANPDANPPDPEVWGQVMAEYNAYSARHSPTPA